MRRAAAFLILGAVIVYLSIALIDARMERDGLRRAVADWEERCK